MWYWLGDEILRSKHDKLNMDHLELHEYAGDFYAVCQYIALLANKNYKNRKFKISPTNNHD